MKLEIEDIIVALIEAGLNYDTNLIIKYSILLKDKSKNDGTNLSKRIEKLLNVEIFVDNNVKPLHIVLDEMLKEKEWINVAQPVEQIQNY